MLNIQQAKHAVEKSDIVSFDVFDTLITRKVLHPVDVFSLVDLLAKKESLIDFDYRKARIQAEQNLVESELNNSYTLKDIINSIGESNGLSGQTIDRLYELELYAEELVAYPRKDIRDFYIDLYNSGKKIVLVSDMYLSSEIIKHLLEKCGYPADVDIFASNEMGATKHSGELWRMVFEKFPGKKIVHFGDNRYSDYEVLKKIGGNAFLVDNPAEKFSSVKMYENLFEHDNGEFGNSLLLGELCNRILFNNVFSESYDKNAVLGLWMGSVLSCFMRSLINNKDDSLLLFVTREGYILQPMYLEYCRSSGVEPQKNCLFYTSRRASAAASLKTVDDIEELLDSSYVDGNIKKLLEHRFGYTLKDDKIGDIQVDLPKKKKQVLKQIAPYVEDILTNSEKLRKVYIEYIEKCRAEAGESDLTIVDLGYSGRAQYYLSRMLGCKVSGKYLFLNPKPYPERIGCECDCVAYTTDSLHPVYDNLLFLEGALSVPYGQLREIRADETGEIIPVCNEPNRIPAEVTEAQKEFIKYASGDAKWYKLLGDFYNCTVTATEDVWACLINYDYLPESYLKSFCLDDDYFGYNNWKYNIEKKIWTFNKEVTPFVFHKKKNLGLNKQKLKNFVKYHTPSFFYEHLRLLWVKYIK